MRLIKKSIGLLLSLIMVMSVFAASPASFQAQSTDKLIKGTFTMETFDGYDPGELEYYYSDSYFSESGKTIDPHLRTMSAALVFTAQGISDTPVETFGRILRNIGFTDIETYDMDRLAMDTIGVVISRKTIGEKDVVCVAIRGDQYGIEMAANMIAGAEGDIRAFADAEELVANRVRDYLDRRGITSAKYWVVGYSRSGAVANLFGRALNEDLSGYATTGDDIYVYAFEPTIASGDDTVYENIHNIIDRRDLLTYVYPAVWSLYGCGVPDYIGDTDETITLKSFELFSNGYSKNLGEVRTSDFTKDFVDFMGTNVSRETFSETLQTPISQILAIYYSLNAEQRSAFLSYWSQVADEIKQDTTMYFIALGALADPYSENSAKSVANLIIKHMDRVSQASGKPVSDDEYDTLQAAVVPVVSVILPIAYKDLSSTYDFGDGDSVSAPLYHVMTVAGNLFNLIKHHLNYNIFYELIALDSYYSNREEVVLGDVDGDGEVTILDATAIQRRLAEMAIPAYNEAAADADADGEVTILDATEIQRWLAKLPSNESIAKPIT